MAVPSVTGLSPTHGSVAGATPVTITGTNFVNTPPTVAFGATAATSVVFVSATSITCVSPAHAAATVDVEVTDSGGTSPSNPPGDSFTFQAAPTIPANFVDIDFTQRAQILNQVGTLINNFITFWNSATAPTSVPDPGSGGTYINATGTLAKYMSTLNAINTEFTLGVTAGVVPDGNIDFTYFQPQINTTLAQLRLLFVAKP